MTQMFTIILALVKGEKHRSISRSRCERNALTLELRHRTEKSQASSSQKLVTPWIISQNKQMNYIGCHTTWQIWFLYMQWANNYDVIFKAAVERSHLSFSYCKRLFKATNFIHYLPHPCPHPDNVMGKAIRLITGSRWFRKYSEMISSRWWSTVGRRKS